MAGALLRASLAVLGSVVLFIALTGERTALLQQAAWWPRHVAYKPGYGGAPTVAEPDEEIACLALNIYFEARGEPEIGRVAVGQVVMNRVADPRFPKTVCRVVRQGGESLRHACQFSWWCDALSDRPREGRAWADSQRIARAVYWGHFADPTRGALWYHATSVAPLWRAGLSEGPRYGAHVFYHRKPSRPAFLQTAAAE